MPDGRPRGSRRGNDVRRKDSSSKMSSANASAPLSSSMACSCGVPPAEERVSASAPCRPQNPRPASDSNERETDGRQKPWQQSGWPGGGGGGGGGEEGVECGDRYSHVPSGGTCGGGENASISALDPDSLLLQNSLQFRFLHPDDIGELKSLCKDCFPVEYPEEWYQEITKDDGRFFSLASTLQACNQGKIVGFIVAEIKTRVRCNKEDQDILSPSYPLSTPVAYILSLGVACNFRCQGVGSLLLDNLLSHLTSKDHQTCKAVFLHVLCTNSRAIRFYEKRHFVKHSFLPLYYAIQGKLKDGFSYVLYVNGGRPPWSFRSSLKSSVVALATKLSPCKMLLRVNQLVWCFVAAIFLGIKKTTSALAVASGGGNDNGGYYRS